MPQHRMFSQNLSKVTHPRNLSLFCVCLCHSEPLHLVRLLYLGGTINVHGEEQQNVGIMSVQIQRMNRSEGLTPRCEACYG